MVAAEAEQSLVAEGVASADRKLYGPMLLMLPADSWLCFATLRTVPLPVTVLAPTGVKSDDK